MKNNGQDPRTWSPEQLDRLWADIQNAPDHRQHDAARASRLRRENLRALRYANRERPRPEAGFGLLTVCAVIVGVLASILAWAVRLAVMHR